MTERPEQAGFWDITAETSLADARRRSAARLAAAGLADADLDSRIFLEVVTGLGRLALLAGSADPLGEGAAGRLRLMLERRTAGEPVWRILGEREFWGLRFRITPDVLDPRPDTETIVEAALAALGRRKADPLNVLDLGVGSGAILAALLHECGQAFGVGVDRSEAACRVAADNFSKLGFDGRSRVINGVWGAALRDNSFDLVVSNPPYIETAVIPTLAREVREHDPLAALDGGADGLVAYRHLAAEAPRLLAPNGILVLEVGAGQADAVSDLLTGQGFGVQAVRRDLGGVDRSVVATLTR